jgi:hypothetical protein
MCPLTTDNSSQGPKEREYPELDVRATYCILQKSHYLYVYANPKAQRSKRIAKFDMLKPEQRQAFVEIRRLTAEKYPPKHKDLLRVRRLHNGGRECQRSRVPLSENNQGKGIAKVTSICTRFEPLALS